MMALIDEGCDESGKGDIIFDIFHVKEAVLELKNELCFCEDKDLILKPCKHCNIIKEILGDFEK